LIGAVNTLKKHKSLLIFEFGLGASDFYDVSTTDFFKFLTEKIGLKMHTLDTFLSKKSRLTLKQFENHYNKNDEFYFVAAR
jgi:hypothetical protein